MDVQSHGEISDWVLSSNSKFPESCLEVVRNSGSTIITTNACHVNAFDKTGANTRPCLSKRLIGDAHNGVIAFWGSSREGIGSDNLSSLGVSQLYETAYYSKLFQNPEENKNFGEVVADAKASFSKLSQSPNVYRWLQFSMNPIGDPEMPIFVGIPDFFNSVKASLNRNLITIDTGIPGCTISVTDDSGNSPIQYVARNTRSIIVPRLNITDNAVLVVSKQNYKPLIVEGLSNILNLGKQKSGEFISVGLLDGKSTLSVKIEVGNNEKASILVTDILGQVKLNQICEGSDCNFNIEYLKHGIYIVTLLIEDVPVDSCSIAK